MQYWYYGQLRRYISQFINIFNNRFSVCYGAGTPNEKYVTIPCVYGDPSRMAETLNQNNTANKAISAPIMSVIIESLSPSDSRRQDPTFVESIIVNERAYNAEEQRYESTVGNRYTVDRYMPIPWDLVMQLDIWTTNLDQKQQVWEQLFVYFNPSINIQTNTNALDWSFLTTVTLRDFKWTSRSVPLGSSMGSDTIDVMSAAFDVPIFLNPPAKVKNQKIINEILFSVKYGEVNNDLDDWTDTTFLSRTTTTPGDLMLYITYQTPGVYSLRLGDNSTWQNLILSYSNNFKGYGQYKTNASYIELNYGENDSIIGYIDYDPNDPTNMLFYAQSSSYPQTNTLKPFDAIVDPQKSGPGQGQLPCAGVGQRYLISSDMPLNSQIWGNSTAKAGDIIEYNGQNWIVVFDSSNASGTYYAINDFNQRLYEFDGSWSAFIKNEYPHGYWHLSI